VSIFDEVNRKYDLRKEEEKEERKKEPQRITRLENAERKLIREFNGYLPKIQSELNNKGFSTLINQTDLNPWLKVIDINTKAWATIIYKSSEITEDKGTVYVEFNSNKSNAADADEYFVDEEDKVKTSDGRKFNLEKEVVRHYEMLLDKF